MLNCQNEILIQNKFDSVTIAIDIRDSKVIENPRTVLSETRSRHGFTRLNDLWVERDQTKLFNFFALFQLRYI